MILFLISKEIRNSFGEIISAIFNEKIVDVYLLMIIYTEIMVLIITLLGFWEMSLLKETIYWTVFVGFPLVVDINKINSEENHIKIILKDTFKGIIIIEFISNFYNFSLVGELIFIPLITFLSLLQIVSKTKPEYEKVYKLINWILLLFGVMVLIYAIRNIYNSPESFFNILSLKIFLLSIILTILFIPFLYILSIWSMYETIIVTTGLRLKEEKDKKYLRKKLFLHCGLNKRKLKRFQKKISFGTIRDKKDIEKVLNVDV